MMIGGGGQKNGIKKEVHGDGTFALEKWITATQFAAAKHPIIEESLLEVSKELGRQAAKMPKSRKPPEFFIIVRGVSRP